MDYNKYLNSEVAVYCVVPYSTFSTGFAGILVSNDADCIVLASAVEFNNPHRKYRSIMIKKDTIISIGQK